jgi:hypothetical protein
MKNVTFINISNKPFTGYYDGKPHTFKAGQSLMMPDYLAKHFAKHLTNKILLEKGHETATSPKFPDQVPQFKEIFDQIYIGNDEAEKTEAEAQIEAANAGREPSMSVPVAGPGKEPQMIGSVDDEDENEEFPELKNEALKDL